MLPMRLLPCRAIRYPSQLAFPWKMKKHLLLILLLLAATLAGAVAQSRPGSRPLLAQAKPAPTPTKARPGVGKTASKGAVKEGSKGVGTKARKAAVALKSGNKSVVQPPLGSVPIVPPPLDAAAELRLPAGMRRITLENPVLVYYAAPAPGRAVQQLIMAEQHLGLLKLLNVEHLLTRREVFVDGLGNRALPGSDGPAYHLLGPGVVAEATRRPAGDGRSCYSRLRVSAPGFLYVVREPAEAYRHFVKGPQQGALLDFEENSLPGLDSVRALYTLRRLDAAERSVSPSQLIR